MLTSGDWVTARLDGVAYWRNPAVYWLIAGSYKIFGVHDWAARIPIALSVHRAGVADGGLWDLGFRKQGRASMRGLHRYLCRAFPVYPGIDSRRDADLHHRARDVGVSARAR